MVFNSVSIRCALMGTVLLAAGGASAQPFGGQTQAAPAGFTLSVFAPVPAGMTAPDSILVVRDHVWVGFGDGAAPDGSSGNSTVVEFRRDGTALRTITLAGHNDGLRFNPNTGRVIAVQNEDAIPMWVEIDPKTGAQTAPIAMRTVNGGGYDDVAFIHGRAFVSASNPALNASGVNTHPAIVNVTPTGKGFAVQTLLQGNALAYDSVTGRYDRLNLTDPDSLTVTPDGDLLMTDQGDAQLILVRLGRGSGPFVQQIPLLGGVQVDDTIFATSTRGVLFFTDTAANTIYKLTSQNFALGKPYSASTGVAATATAPAVPAFIGQTYLDSGTVRPIVTGLTAPHGMAFMPNTAN